MPTYSIIIILAAFAFSIWLPWVIQKNNKRRREEMEELQARQNWIIDEKGLPALGSGTIKYRVRSKEDHWEVLSVVTRSADTKDTTGTVVEFSQPWKNVDSGLFVIGPSIPAKEMALFGSMMGGLLVQMVANASCLPAEDMARLEVQKTDAPVTALATPGAAGWVNVQAIAGVVKPWSERFRGEKLHPILLLGNGKFRVRVRGNFSKAADIEAFITMALAARGALSL